MHGDPAMYSRSILMDRALVVTLLVPVATAHAGGDTWFDFEIGFSSPGDLGDDCTWGRAT